MKKTYLYNAILIFTVTFSATQSLLAANQYSMKQPTYKTLKSAQTAIRAAAEEAGTTINPDTMLQNAENSYTAMLSEMSGVSESDLRKMHSSGISWKDLPGELGMQTAVTTRMDGKGFQENRNSQSTMITNENSMEMQAATARNIETGGVVGHGRGIQTNVNSGTHGNMMSGAGGLNNGMEDMETETHENDMSGGMGGSGSSGMGGSSGSGGGMGSSGGMGGGMGGGMH